MQLLPLSRFGEPGESLDITEDIVAAARYCFVLVYNRINFTGTLDELRAHLFANTKGDTKGDLRSLLPTEDTFCLHVRRT